MKSLLGSAPYKDVPNLNDLETENTFISATSGKKEKFLKWHKDEPSHYGHIEHCVELGCKLWPGQAGRLMVMLSNFMNNEWKDE
ncbi:uncharacterized protein Dwil_GK28246 [Drosophila willistoni]|uniref:Uncharacterized protein n=1 Tax=Drosophila willistoni TaxID=7260 RepID=A0A0Q9X0V5_DROWI|nr:uncharacterized protein Dwil_GK28246 [Drosophila willistoni]